MGNVNETVNLFKDLNCCKGGKDDNIQIKTEDDMENGNEFKPIKVEKAKANVKFKIEEEENDNYNEIKHLETDNGNKNKEDNKENQILTEDNTKHNESFIVNNNNTNNQETTKHINTNVDTDLIIKSLQKKTINDREKDFPLFTKEYAISKGNISEELLNQQFNEENLIYDHGTLIENKSFYYGFRSKQNNMRHGFGTLLLSDGTKYEGFWIENEFSLYGRHIDSDLTVYEGQFKNGILNGDGTESTLTTTYTGSFSNGIKQGYGIFKTQSDTYEGNFEQGLKHGKGKIFFTNTQNYYEGEFISNKIEGYGKFKWASEDQYEGTFKNGILHGEGVYKWKNGDVYTGPYLNGVRCGNGKLVNSNGKIYEGSFENNLPHGKGVVVKDGRKSIVEFNNGVPVNSKRKTSAVNENQNNN